MGLLVTNKIINHNNNDILRSNGNIVQVVRVRTDTITTWASNNTGNGTILTNLNLTVTPKRAQNRLIMRWNLFHEVHYNNVFVIHRDGAIITTAGEEGYNNTAGNIRWCGFTPQTYDQNESSTPNVITILYTQIAGSTTSRTYAPAVRSSDASNWTYYQNRTVSSSGQAYYENGVSFGILYEVTV